MRWFLLVLMVCVAIVVPKLIRGGLFVNRQSFQLPSTECYSVESYVDDMDTVQPLYGPEDVVILDSERVAFIGSDLRKNDSVEGVIVLFDISDHANHRQARKLKVVGWEDTGQAFKPHGIDVRKIDDKYYLFVVVHAKPLPDSVAIFQIMKVNGQFEELHLVHHIKHSLFRELNEIVSVDLSALPFLSPSFDGLAFYTSNALYNPIQSLSANFEMVTERAWGSVAFCALDVDSADWHCELVLANMIFPNGLALSKNQDRLYVAHSGVDGLKAFAVSHKLSSAGNFLQATVSFPPLLHAHTNQFGVSLLDNIEIDTNTANDSVTLFLAAHQQAWRFFAHVADDDTDAGSVVWKVSLPDGKNHSKLEVRKVFADDGQTLSAASVAAHFQSGEGEVHHLLIGGVFRAVLLHCTLSAEQL